MNAGTFTSNSRLGQTNRLLYLGRSGRRALQGGGEVGAQRFVDVGYP